MAYILNKFQPGFRLIDGSDLNAMIDQINAGAGPGAGPTYYVNATIGNDGSSNSGFNPYFPLATIDQAIALEKAALSAAGLSTVGRGATIAFWGTIHKTATLAWTLPGTNLVGLTATSNNSRSRISSTGATPFSPLVNVTGVGNGFAGFDTFHGGFTGGTGSQVCWAEAGGRNGYNHVGLQGGGDATIAALAGMRSLTIGSDENLFEDCTFGLDTIQRITAANATVEVINGGARNILRRGQFQSWNGLNTNVQVLVAANGMDRYLLLDGVSMLNFGTAMSAAITNAGGSPGGNVVLTPTCVSVGATAIATTGNVYCSGPVPTATTSNIGILAT